MIPLLLLLTAAAALLVGAMGSGVRTGLCGLNRVRLRLRADRHDPAAGALSRMIDDPEPALAFVSIVIAAADFLLAAAAVALFLHVGASTRSAVAAATLSVAPLRFALAGAFLQRAARRDPERFVFPVWRPLVAGAALARACRIVPFLRAVTNQLVRRISPRTPATDASVRGARSLAALHDSAVAETLSPGQREMVERVLALNDLRVSRVMIPLARAVIVDEQTSRPDFLRVIRMAHFSRIPLFRKSPTAIVGVVNVYDVLADDSDRPIRHYMRSQLSLSAAEPVSAALFQMQSARQAMAAVVNPRGECVGIVTLKDLVEEIVGDLSAW